MDTAKGKSRMRQCELSNRVHSGGAVDCDCDTCLHNQGDHDLCELGSCEGLLYDAAEYAKGYQEATE